MLMRRFSFSLALQKFQQSPIFSLHTPAFPLLNTKILSILAVSVLLYACGGGGSGKLVDLQQDAGAIAPSGSGPAETLSIGNGSGDSFTSGAITANQTELEAGESTAISINVVNQNNEPPAADITITMSSSCASGGLASISTAVEISPGLFSADYCTSSNPLGQS
jgi:hypothetical protein